MKRHIINLYTKKVLPKLIETLDVDSKFNVQTYLETNTKYQKKDVKIISFCAYDDSLIDSERVYKHLNILNIKKY